MPLHLTAVDYHNPTHARDLAVLLDLYSRDIMGNGEPLSDDILGKLALELAKLPGLGITYIDDTAVGMAGVLQIFHLKCRPLVNIHDLRCILIFVVRGLERKFSPLLRRKQSNAIVARSPSKCWKETPSRKRLSQVRLLFLRTRSRNRTSALWEKEL